MRVEPNLNRRCVGWIACLAFAFLTLPGSSAAQTARAETRPPNTETRGLVQPSQRVRLHAPLDGVLATLHVGEGDRVKKGDPLAVMKDDVQKARVRAARTAKNSDGDLRSARVALRKAKDRLERVQRALAQDAATDWELRESQMAVDEAGAAVDAAQERRSRDQDQLEVENEILNQYTLRAPFDGVINRVEFDEGASLSPQDAVIEIVGLSQLEAVIFLPVERFGAVEQGADYRLVGEAPIDVELVATLRSVDAVLDPGSRTFRAVFEIDNQDGKLPAGFHVRLLDRTAPPAVSTGPDATQSAEKPND